LCHQLPWPKAFEVIVATSRDRHDVPMVNSILDTAKGLSRIAKQHPAFRLRRPLNRGSMGNRDIPIEVNTGAASREGISRQTIDVARQCGIELRRAEYAATIAGSGPAP
jgi:hypothetical protein